MLAEVGASASLSKTISMDQIEQFASLSGDFNPVHLDEEFARKTRFGRRIAHGMWAAALISAVLGTKLPGPGTVGRRVDDPLIRETDIGRQANALIRAMPSDRSFRYRGKQKGFSFLILACYEESW
jgi:hypothetical protein